MIALGVIAIAYASLAANKKNRKTLTQLRLEGNKNTYDNNRQASIFDPKKYWSDNLKLGNWAWGRPAIPTPSGTKAYYREPTPQLAGLTDWMAEGNQWLRSPEFRNLYVQQWQNAWSTENSQAVRTQLVPGFWHETITKGRVLFQENKADGKYNPNGVNLFAYQ